MPIADEYKVWFSDICTRVGLPDAARACEEGGLVLNEVPILFAPAHEPSMVQLQTLIDVLPPKSGAFVLRKMLEIQMMSYTSAPTVFGLEPLTDTVFLMSHIKPSEIEPEDAVLALQLLAATAAGWRALLKDLHGMQPSAAARNKLMTKMKNTQ